jgi:formylglycine-generating enzyme required for sulfatase activity
LRRFKIIFFVFILYTKCIGNLQIQEKPDIGILKPTSSDTNLCKSPPEGMVCVPFSGNDLNKKNLSTFYVDKYEITNEKYETCVKEKHCKPNLFIKNKSNSQFAGPIQPAIGLTYDMAHQYCIWSGKRLPTEDEWDKIYSIYSIKIDKLDCKTANIGCEGSTKPVGSYPNPKGVFDLEGNATEWVNEWTDSCGVNCNDKSCGEICTTNINSCSGKYPCEKYNEKYTSIIWDQLNLDGIRNSLKSEKLQMKKIKGGSFEFPFQLESITIGKIAQINDTTIKASARCVSDSNYLNNAPAWIISNPPVSKDFPIDLNPEQKSLFLQTFEKDDIDTKPLCKEQFTSPANCRDPVSYIKPNEARNYLFAPYIKNLGGGYIGVAADANYTFLTYARSEFVWLMDFNINIVNLHKINKIFILESESVEDFLNKWSSKNKSKSLKLLEFSFSTSSEWKNIRNFFEVNQPGLYEYYEAMSKPDRTMKDFGWLRNPVHYSYLRNLHQKNRISIIEGDLLKDKSLYNIGVVAKKLKIPIRLFYPSNAEEFWKFSKNYKRNILNLPFDEATILLRTVHEFPWHKPEMKNGVTGFWHYVVHGGYNYQKKLALPDFYLIDNFKEYRIFPDNQKDFSTIEIPNSLPFELK